MVPAAPLFTLRPSVALARSPKYLVITIAGNRALATQHTLCKELFYIPHTLQHRRNGRAYEPKLAYAGLALIVRQHLSHDAMLDACLTKRQLQRAIADERGAKFRDALANLLHLLFPFVLGRSGRA